MPLLLPKWMVGTGKPKGMLQVLYERGLYRVGMQKEVTEEANAARAKRDTPLPPIPTEMDASATLGRCEDYANEVSFLEQLFLDRGHVLFESVKCHPEMAVSNTPGANLRWTSAGTTSGAARRRATKHLPRVGR